MRGAEEVQDAAQAAAQSESPRPQRGVGAQEEQGATGSWQGWSDTTEWGAGASAVERRAHALAA